MTAIVAVKDPGSGRVIVGGDSFSGTYEYALETATPKVFSRGVYDEEGTLRCSALMGVSGDHRGSVLLRNMKLPPWPKALNGNAEVYVGLHLVNAMRQVFQEGGYTLRENERESHDLNLLVGIAGRLFSVWQTFDVIESKEYMAVGCGMDFALGALHATRGMKAEDRVRRALEAAAEHHPMVRPPFYVAVGGEAGRQP
jgi:ATP-dependent protease HslVU (ClpYQ) peptidase subunit